MNFIEGLTDQPAQNSTLVLPDGSRVTLYLEYKPQQSSWFYSIYWPGTNDNPFTLNTCRLVCSPNFLRQFRDLIPFGISLIATPNNIDPISQSCFVDGTAEMILLDSEDVQSVEDTLFKGS